MGLEPTRPERTLDVESKAVSSQLDATEGVQASARFACTPACTSEQETDHELALIAEAWPTLPEHIKLAIVALVQSASARA